MHPFKRGYFEATFLLILCTLAMQAQYRYRIAAGDVTVMLYWVGVVCATLSILNFVSLVAEDLLPPENPLSIVLDRLRAFTVTIVILYFCGAVALFINAWSNKPIQMIKGNVVAKGTTLTFAESFSRHAWVKMRAKDGSEWTTLLKWQENQNVWPSLAVEVGTREGTLGLPVVITIERDAEIRALEILAVTPTATTALEELIYLYSNTGRINEALDRSRQLLSFRKAGDSVWRAGSKLFQRGNLSDAIQFFKLAFEASPTQTHTTTYGWVLVKLGRAEEGLPYLQQAVEMDRTHMYSHYHLAYTLLQVGRHDEAIASFREVLKLKPGYPEIIQQLQKLGAAP